MAGWFKSLPSLKPLTTFSCVSSTGALDWMKRVFCPHYFLENSFSVVILFQFSGLRKYVGSGSL